MPYTRSSPSRARLATAMATAVFAALTAACGASGSGNAAEDGTVTMGVGLSIGASPVALSDENGDFGQGEFDVEFVETENPPSRVAAVMSGSVDVVELPTPSFLGAVAEGLPLHVIAAQFGYPAKVENTGPYDKIIDVMVAKDSPIQDMGDLEGSTIGVPAREDLMEIMISGEIEAAGGDPSSVKWVVLDFKSQVAALDAGRLDAISVPLPFNVQAKSNGARTIATPSGGFYDGAPITVWAVGDAVANDSELVASLRDAVYEANAYANDHRQETRAFIAQRTGVPLETLDASGAEFYFPTELNVASLQALADRMNGLGFLPRDLDVEAAVLSQAGEGHS